MTTGGIPYFKDINLATDKESWTNTGVNSAVSSYEINTQLANVRFSTTDDVNQPETFTQDRSPTFNFSDMSRVFAQLHYQMRGSGRHDLISGEVIGLFPPERPFAMQNSQGNNATYIVATGVEMDLRRETTKGTWHEHLDLT
jgi:hypothetical protein